MTFYPRLPVASEEQIRRIHEKSIDMLDRFGIDVRDPALRELMLERGCRLIHNGRVQISHELIDDMIRTNRSVIRMESLFGEKAEIRRGGHYTHAFGGAANVLEPDGRLRKGTCRDMIDAILLSDGLDNMSVSCNIVYPTDVDQRIAQFLQFSIPVLYSRKPIGGAAMSHPGPARYLAELYKLITGGRKDAPSPFMTHVSPQSPFIWPKEDTDCVRALVGAGIPTTMLAAPMAGMSGPMSVVGEAAQCHAEVLAFGVLYYLINPDAVRIYGSRCFFPNMRTCQLSIGLPENAMASALTAQLADYCGFISDVNGAYATGCTSDVQSGCEKMQNSLYAALAGATFITGAGSLAGGTVYSPLQYVIDDEIMGRVQRLLTPTDLSEEDFCMEALRSVVLEGSTFLSEEQTIEYLSDLYRPEISFNDTWAEWTAGGMPELRERAAEKAARILADRERVLPDPGIEKEIAQLTAAAEKELTA